MSYCVNCGVKLADGLQECPLCGVAVNNPAQPHSDAPPLFPIGAIERAPQHNRRAAALVVAIVLLIPLLSAHTCDIAINGSFTWSRYVAVGYLILYGFAFPRLLIRRHPISYSILVGYLCLSAALWMLCSFIGGEWFFSFALPLTTVSAALTWAIYLLLRHTPWNILKISGATLIAIGFFTLLVEWLVNSCFYSGKPLLWSLITVIPCVLLGVVLFIIDANRSLKQSVKRRFFF